MGVLAHPWGGFRALLGTMKLLIGIPAFNEEKIIGQVIKSLPEKIAGVDKIDVLVVDDGSTDSTGKIARKTDCHVLTHLLNRGLGAALKTVFAYTKLKKYDILVTFDADGQHDTRDLPGIINPIVEGKSDVVIGTRWKNKVGAPLIRFWINKIANILTYFLYGIKTSDSQSGFRAFGRRAIETVNLQSDGMEVSSEFFREIYRNRLKFAEVPIKAVYTAYSQAKGQRLSNAFNIFFQLIMRLLR